MIKLIQHPELFELQEIENAVMIAYVDWSKYAVGNCTECTHFLREQNYSGEIIQLYLDNATQEFQKRTFKELCQGWGEIFVVVDGQITDSYFGKDCLTNFKIKYLEDIVR